MGWRSPAVARGPTDTPLFVIGRQSAHLGLIYSQTRDKPPVRYVTCPNWARAVGCTTQSPDRRHCARVLKYGLLTAKIMTQHAHQWCEVNAPYIFLMHPSTYPCPTAQGVYALRVPHQPYTPISPSTIHTHILYPIFPTHPPHLDWLIPPILGYGGVGYWGIGRRRA